MSKHKTFWRRPEGKTGLLFIFIFIILIFFGIRMDIFTSLLENLISNLGETVAIAILFLFLFFITLLLIYKKTRRLIWYSFRNLMRWITGIFIQLDPIKTLETYVRYLYKELRIMQENISRLSMQISKIDGIISKNKIDMEQSIRIAEQAKKQERLEIVTINTRQYGRLKESNEKYSDLKKRMLKLSEILNKIEKNTTYLVKDTENEVKMKKQESIAINAGHTAMRKASKILDNDSDRKRKFNIATEKIADDVYKKIANIEKYIDLSADVIDSIDIQNIMFEQEGLDMLEKMEKEKLK